MTEELIKEVDTFHSEKKFEEVYTLLKRELEKEENQVAEIHWRMARACREMANLVGESDHKKKKDYLFEGFDNSQKGMEKDEQNFGSNKWHGIMLDLTAREIGTKKRIENSFLVKEHLERASKINENDATIMHTLGVWCFEVADLGWLQKKLAAAFFATPPTSSYEEALKYLKKAEELSPGFYLFNWVYLGKCLLRMGRKAEAKKYLQDCVNAAGRPDGSSDDAQAIKEAKELIKGC